MILRFIKKIKSKNNNNKIIKKHEGLINITEYDDNGNYTNGKNINRGRKNKKWK